MLEIILVSWTLLGEMLPANFYFYFIFLYNVFFILWKVNYLINAQPVCLNIFDFTSKLNER